MNIKIRIITLMILIYSFLAFGVTPVAACSCVKIPVAAGEKAFPEPEPFFVYRYPDDCCGSHTISLSLSDLSTIGGVCIVFGILAVIVTLIIKGRKRTLK
jgi:hypothetical protein